MNKDKIKTKLEELQLDLDKEVGTFKRLLMQGWMAKPAWARALVWFCVGLVIGTALK